MNNQTALAVARQAFYKYSISDSQAAERAFLQSLRNDTIAGVPVVFGTPKGVKSSDTPGDARLVIYLHGGGAWGLFD